MASYEFNGNDYGIGVKHDREWGQKLLSELELEGGERILDLGCGDGALTEELARRVPHGHVLGVDASEGVLETARSRCADNLHFEQMNLTALRFQEEFDVIYSNAALHWVKNHERLLYRARRALRPGGRLCWSFAAEDSGDVFCRIVRDAMRDPDYRDAFENFAWPWFMPNAQEYEALLRRSGFTDFTVAEEQSETCFDDPEELLAWLDTPALVPFLGVLPEHLRADFRDEIAVAMIENSRHSRGTYYKHSCRLQLTARK